MESTAFFEKKIHLTPSDLNQLKKTTTDQLILTRAKELLEKKCSEHGYILPGSIQMISRSMAHFEPARFTADAVYYVKLEGKVIYPVDGIEITGKVIRKNKMGLYVNYRDAIHIQVPRDLHLGNIEYDSVEVGDTVTIEMKRSRFAVNDLHILATGIFLSKEDSGLAAPSTRNASLLVPLEDEKADSEASEDEEEESEDVIASSAEVVSEEDGGDEKEEE